MVGAGEISVGALVLKSIYKMYKYKDDTLAALKGVDKFDYIIGKVIRDVAEEEAHRKPLDLIMEFLETPEIAELIDDAAKMKLTDEKVNERLGAIEGISKDILSEIIRRAQEKIKPRLSDGETLSLESLAGIAENVKTGFDNVFFANAKRDSILTTRLDEIEGSLEQLKENFDEKDVEIITSILDKAKRYIDSSDYELAEVALMQLDEFSDQIASADISIYSNYWGCVYLGLNNSFASIAYFRKAIETGDEPKYRINLLNALVASRLTDNLKEAESMFTGIPEEERNASYYNAKGNYYLYTKERDNAYKTLMKALELEPDLIHARLNLCNLYLDFREFEEYEAEMPKIADVISCDGLTRELTYHYYSTRARYYIMKILESGFYNIKDPDKGYVTTTTLDVPDELKGYARNALREYERASHEA